MPDGSRTTIIRPAANPREHDVFLKPFGIISQSAYVMKRGNARGAKGVGHQRWIGSTGNGRKPIINGRRQPSLGGTSRMNREVHVRICAGQRVEVNTAAGPISPAGIWDPKRRICGGA